MQSLDENILPSRDSNPEFEPQPDRMSRRGRPIECENQILTSSH